MPDFNRNVGDFDAEGSPLTAKVWIERLVSMARIHNWPDDLMLEVTRTHLVGAAGKWFCTYMDELHTWNIFKTRFRKTFVRDVGRREKWRMMSE